MNSQTIKNHGKEPEGFDIVSIERSTNGLINK